MRRSIVFLAPITLCLLAVFACEDSGGGNFGTLDLDAGKLDVVAPPPTPAFDAGAADADAAAPSIVTVAVLGSAAARAGVTVVFSDASGAVIETKTTDAAGKATSTGATTPAMATALLKNENRHSIVTWTGVAGGDVLATRALESTETPALVGTFDVTVAPPGGTSTQTVEASNFCSSPVALGAQTVNLDVAPPCVFGATTSVVARAGATTDLVAADVYAFKKNVALPGALTPLTLDGWAAPVAATLTVSSEPADSSSTLRLLEISAGAPFREQVIGLDGTTQTFDVVDGFADALQAEVLVNRYATSHNDVIVRKSGSTSLTADLGSPLPAIGVPDDVVTGVPARPTFHWTGDTTATSGGVVQIPYTGPEDSRYTWTIFVPAGATSVTAPALPVDAAAAFLPTTATLEAYRTSQLGIVFVAGPGFTPATLRAAAFASIDVADNGPEEAFGFTPMPADGTYKMTVYRPQLAH